jgi:O-antigen/teichoic acid export membrane protein
MLNTDVLILGWFRSAEEVGFYAAAQRIVQLLYAIPIVLAVAAFPIFSRLARREDAKAKRILEMVLSFSLLLALPLAAGGLILDKAIMEFVFGGQYVQAALPFGLLSLTLIPIFPSIILSNTVFAYGAQRKLAVFTAIGGIANVLLDLVFIPPWGAAGSAAATILSQALAITYLYRSAQESLRFELWRHIKKILAATALMGLFVYWLFSASGLSVLWIVCAGATLYAILLYAFKEPVLEKTRLILSNSLIGAENDLL